MENRAILNSKLFSFLVIFSLIFTSCKKEAFLPGEEDLLITINLDENTEIGAIIYQNTASTAGKAEQFELTNIDLPNFEVLLNESDLTISPSVKFDFETSENKTVNGSFSLKNGKKKVTNYQVEITLNNIDETGFENTLQISTRSFSELAPTGTIVGSAFINNQPAPSLIFTGEDAAILSYNASTGEISNTIDFDGQTYVDPDSDNKLIFTATHDTLSANYQRQANDVPSVSQSAISFYTPTQYGTTTIPGGRKLYEVKTETWHADGDLSNPIESTNILYKKFLFGNIKMDTATFENEANNPPALLQAVFNISVANQAINQLIADGNMPTNIVAGVSSTNPPAGYIDISTVPGAGLGDLIDITTNEVVLTKIERQNYVKEIVYRLQVAGVQVGFGVGDIDGSILGAPVITAKLRFIELCRDNPITNKIEMLGLVISEQIP